MVNKKASWVKPFLKSSSNIILLMVGSLTCVSGIANEPEEIPQTQNAEDGKEQQRNYVFPQFKTCPINSANFFSPEKRPPAFNPLHDTNSLVKNQESAPGFINVLSDEAYTENGSAFLSGNVLVTQEGQTLSADTLTANDENQSYTAQGNLLVNSDDFVISADNLFYQADSGSSQIENTRFHLFSNNGNGLAKSITVDNKQILTLYDADFSTCPEEERSWQFESDKIEIDSESGWGKAYGSVIKVADIPVFYLPYITFPIDDRRVSGILAPGFSNSDRNGRDISVPYYFNLAPNYDLTLTPRYISKRGEMLGTEFRYLTEDSSGITSFEFMPEDDLFTDSNNNKLKRWQYDISHKQKFSQHWTAQIDARKVSDDSFFQDFGGGVISSNQDTLSQRFNLEYLTSNWLFKTQYQDWQLLNSPTERYKIAPRIELTRYFDPDVQGLSASIKTEFTRFENEQEFIESANRAHIEPTIGFSIESLYGFIRPTASYSFTEYTQIDQLNNKETQNRGLPTFSLDSGLFFERSINIGSESYTHTFEPRAYYLYTPFEEQSAIGIFDTSLPTFNFTQLFSRNRFSGIDRIGDTSQVSGSITSKVLDSKGKEKLSVSLGRIVYLKDRRIQLTDTTPVERFRQSGLLAEVNWRFAESLEVKGSIEWDDQVNNTTQGLLKVHYEPVPNRILNLGHRYRQRFDKTEEQAELAFAWPIHHNWRLLGRYSRDLAENRTNDSFVGLEYESCCWALRVVSRRYLNIQLDNEGFAIPGQGDQHNSGVFLQFVLKGVGSLRGSTTQFLEDNIYGYQDILGQ